MSCKIWPIFKDRWKVGEQAHVYVCRHCICFFECLNAFRQHNLALILPSWCVNFLLWVLHQYTTRQQNVSIYILYICKKLWIEHAYFCTTVLHTSSSRHKHNWILCWYVKSEGDIWYGWACASAFIHIQK